jgi:AbiV family abortive infection protein
LSINQIGYVAAIVMGDPEKILRTDEEKMKKLNLEEAMKKSQKNMRLISDAWTGIDACYSHSLDLSSSAESLYQAGHFVTSALLSFYAIEEAMKGLAILRAYLAAKGQKKFTIDQHVFKHHEFKQRVSYFEDGRLYSFGPKNIHETIGKERTLLHKRITHVDYENGEWKIPQVTETGCEQYLREARDTVSQLEFEIKANKAIEDGTFGKKTIHIHTPPLKKRKSGK